MLMIALAHDDRTQVDDMVCLLARSTSYHIEAIVWRAPDRHGHDNQTVTLRAVISGRRRTITRTAWEPCPLAGPPPAHEDAGTPHHALDPHGACTLVVPHRRRAFGRWEHLIAVTPLMSGKDARYRPLAWDDDWRMHVGVTALGVTVMVSDAELNLAETLLEQDGEAVRDHSELLDPAAWLARRQETQPLP